MMAQWANLTYEKYFDLALIDRATDSRLLNSGALMFHLEGCSVESQRWSITPKGYVIGTVAFSGLLYNNHMS